MTKAHVFVDDLEAPELSFADRHHLERALRVRPGELVTVGDGAGSTRACRFGPVLEPEEEVRRSPRPEPSVTVAFAVVKGERTEWAVQKLTEVGVDRIVLLLASRSVVRWDASRAARQHERLERVAREAAMQSRRSWLPAVEGLRPFSEVAAWPDVALADPSGGRPSLARPGLLVGPEGGWSEEERAAGLPAVSLGPHVLRSETAAVCGGFLLCALRDGVMGIR